MAVRGWEERRSKKSPEECGICVCVDTVLVRKCRFHMRARAFGETTTRCQNFKQNSREYTESRACVHPNVPSNVCRSTQGKASIATRPFTCTNFAFTCNYFTFDHANSMGQYEEFHGCIEEHCIV